MPEGLGAKALSGPDDAPAVVMACSAVDRRTGIMAAVAPLAEGLRREGAYVAVIGPAGIDVSAAGGGTEASDRRRGKRGYVEPSVRAFAEAQAMWRGLAAVTSDHSPVVVHVHGVWRPANIAACLFCIKRGIPYAVSPHGMLMPAAITRSRWRKSWAIAAYVRRFLEYATVVHVTSAAERASVTAIAPRARVELIPWGIDVPTDDTLPARRAEHREALYVGRLLRLKGADDLIDAWAAVRPGGWTLRLVGPDPAGLAERLRRQVSDLALEDAVTVSHDEPPETVASMMQAASLVVLPSHSENFGFVVAEALARGTPVLTTTATPWAAINDVGCGWCVEDSVSAITALNMESHLIDKRCH